MRKTTKKGEMQDRPLAGKIAIVTGAGSPMGMGRAMTLGLVRAGARVAMLDVNEDWLGQTADEVRAVGGDDSRSGPGLRTSRTPMARRKPSARR